ncbi:hypothetical protein [Terrisporobacter glycolicus]|uniref:Phage protein n=1 Tax=Terrisporobacter glycolicus ATCC 14880 = DSM 1288 TaxID=1121315 RepID=A0ABZ2EXH7_9FIRM|nr:hypothetical protein [Terrisporobacter glycolicus]
MEYVTYLEYTEFSKGKSIPEESFNDLIGFAWDFIDCITLNRIHSLESIPTGVYKAVCVVINEKYKIDKEKENGVVTQEKIGDYSVSYHINEDAKASETRRLYNVAKMYLASTCLLFRGVGI